MYREAGRTINHGLSLGARLLLGAFATLFGIITLLTAPPTNKAVFFYFFGIFCLLIAVACFTQGRARQFIGSVIGCTIFGLGIWYLAITFSRQLLVQCPQRAFGAQCLLISGLHRYS